MLPSDEPEGAPGDNVAGEVLALHVDGAPPRSSRGLSARSGAQPLHWTPPTLSQPSRSAGHLRRSYTRPLPCRNGGVHMHGPDAGADRRRGWPRSRPAPVERRRVSRPAFVLRFSVDAVFRTGGDSDGRLV